AQSRIGFHVFNSLMEWNMSRALAGLDAVSGGRGDPPCGRSSPAAVAGHPIRCMPNAFDFSASPFDCLDVDEQRVVRDGVDIAYFVDDAVILDPAVEPTHLFVVIKGRVSQIDGDEVVATYGPADCFD